MVLLTLTLLVAASPLSVEGDSAPWDSDLHDLSLLPLDRLLAVKRALTHKDINPPEPAANSSSTPDSGQSQEMQAEALRGDPGSRRTPPRRKGGLPPSLWVEEDDNPWKPTGGGGVGGKGKGGLQAIFQGTVTVLAFLAFGGYLICLVINALKEKTAALEMTLLTTVAPARRQRREVELHADKEIADNMYTTMRTLAEAYAKYNQGCLDE